MENKNKIFILFMVMISVCFTFLFLFNQHSMSETHEKTHKAIALSNGCIDYELKVNYLSDSYFVCKKYDLKYKVSDEMEMYLHSINEIVSYNANYIATVLVGCFCLSCMLIIAGLSIYEKK